VVVLQPSSQPAQCISLVASSFYSVQGLVGERFGTSDEDERWGLGVMVEMWKVGGEDASRRVRVVDVAQGQNSTRKSAEDAKEWRFVIVDGLARTQ